MNLDLGNLAFAVVLTCLLLAIFDDDNNEPWRLA